MIWKRDAPTHEFVLAHSLEVFALETDRPLDGVSTPDKTLKKVLLPAPLGPMIDVTRPGRNAP